MPARENEELLLVLGQSKMEKMQENFVMTDKETGYAIIQRVGPQAFTMWWYLWGKCYGRSRIFAYPNKKTMADELLGTDYPEDPKERERELQSRLKKIQRWTKLLEEDNIIKRVPMYNTNGLRRGNLIIMNASYPDIPEGWDTIFEDGVIYQNKTIIARKIEKEIVREEEIEPLIQPTGHFCPVDNDAMDKNVHTKKSAWTNSSTPDLRTGQIRPEDGTKLSRRGDVEVPSLSSPQDRFLRTEEEKREEDKIMNVYMENAGAFSPSSNLFEIAEFDREIMDAIYAGCQKIEVRKGVDGTGYFDEFYMMLLKHFPNQLSSEVIDLAFSLYNQKAFDLYQMEPVNIKNPTGWLYDCYRDAIQLHKALKYKEEIEKKEEAKSYFKKRSHYHFSKKNSL